MGNCCSDPASLERPDKKTAPQPRSDFPDAVPVPPKITFNQCKIRQVLKVIIRGACHFYQYGASCATFFLPT